MSGNLAFNGSQSKHWARDIVHIQTQTMFNPSHNRKLSYLGFAGTEPELEFKFKGTYGNALSMTSLEIDPERFQQQTQIVKELDIPIDLRLTKDIDYFIQYKGSHNIIWLDYCGQRCNSVHDAIDKCLENGILVTEETPALFAITLMATRETIYMDHLSWEAHCEIRNTNSKKKVDFEFLREVGAPNYWNSLANKHGLTLVPIQYFRYKDGLRNKKAAPMILYVFKVEKGIKEVDFTNIDSVDYKSKKKKIKLNLSQQKLIKKLVA